MNHKKIYEFYREYLINKLLPFWIERSPDGEHGGFFTCFDNATGKLAAKDKYTWSQGRMVWIMSKLGSMNSCFNESERREFLALAKNGAEFIKNNAVLDGYRCAFLTDGAGKPKPASDDGVLDSSIFADGFAVMGFARYASVTGDKNFYNLAVNIYDSMMGRIKSGNYYTLPYPEIPWLKTHGILMGQIDISKELAAAMKIFGDKRYVETNMTAGPCIEEIFDRFKDKNNIIREMIYKDKGVDDNLLLTRYFNPGHTIENMWFIMHWALKNKNKSFINTAAIISRATFDYGWDKKYGGLQLFADCEGGEPKGSTTGIESEEMTRKVQNDWASKLWWPHSEALYTLLLAYKLTGEKDLFSRYEKLYEYVFATFPNPDESVGEWINIRDRQGNPENRVVALPVKDPYHTMRNVILIMDLAEHWDDLDSFMGVMV